MPATNPPERIIIKINDVKGDKINFSNAQYVDEQAFQYLKDKLSPLNIEQLHLLLKYGSNKHHKA